MLYYFIHKSRFPQKYKAAVFNIDNNNKKS